MALWLRGRGLIRFLLIFSIQKSIILCLDISTNGVKKVQFCYMKKTFFSKNLTIRVQEGLQPQAISYLGLDMLKMPKTSKIIF